MSPVWRDAVAGILDAYLGTVPDNWARNISYNIPLDELMRVIDHAVTNGYSVDWDGDVSERGFCHAQGVALLPCRTTI